MQLPSRVWTLRGGEARRSGSSEEHQDRLTLFILVLYQDARSCTPHYLDALGCGRCGEATKKVVW